MMRASIVVLPLPDAFDQPLAAELVPAEFLLLQQPPLDDGLGGDAGVIGAGHPEGLEPLHPLLADEDVLQRVVQGVAQVQAPVTFGGGMTIVYGFRAGFGSLWK